MDVRTTDKGENANALHQIKKKKKKKRIHPKCCTLTRLNLSSAKLVQIMTLLSSCCHGSTHTVIKRPQMSVQKLLVLCVQKTADCYHGDDH